MLGNRMAGEVGMLWSIGRVIDKGRYLMAYVPHHPAANKDGYVYHHRVVMENKLGRLLGPDEVVHHRNENKKDNRPGNLHLEDRADHTSHHARMGVTWVEMICPKCGAIFHRERRQTHLAKGGKFSTCSTECRAGFTRYLQLYGETMEARRRMRANVKREYIK